MEGMGMKRVFRNWLKVLGVMTVMLLWGSGNVWGQSQNITVSVKVTRIDAYKDVANVFKNKFRYKIDVNGVNEGLIKFDVKEDDLPGYTEPNVTYTHTVNYDSDNTIKIRAFGWEENCSELNGDDDTFNTGKLLCGVNADRHIADKFIDITYKDEVPGVWHEKSITDNTNFKVYIEYMWSIPKVPKPTSLPGEICRGDNEAHFEVPVHNERRHAVRWDWQKVEWQEQCTTIDNCDECDGSEYSTKKLKDICLQTCMTTSCKDVLVPITTYNDAGKILEYKASENKTELVRYRQWYSISSAVYSNWSEPQSRNYQDHYYSVTVPTGIKTAPNGALRDAVTNLYCGSTEIILTVMRSSGSWKDHEFTWYRKVGDGEYEPLEIEDATPYDISDNDFATFPGQKLQYKVEVNRNGCNTKYTQFSNPLFFFEDVPSLSEIIDETNDIEKASCNNSKDGEITIRASSANPDLRYYYNIGLLDDEGNVQSTEIYSSDRVRADTEYTFRNLLPGDYKVQSLHGGYERAETTGYTKKDDLSNAGYCFSEHTVSVGVKPTFTINSPTSTEVTCYEGADGSIRGTYENAEGSVNIVLQKEGEQNPTTSTVTGSPFVINGLNAGTYTYTITDGRSCDPVPSGTITIDEPLALNVSTTIRTYPDEGVERYGISCFGEKDGEITIDPSDGNKNKVYELTLERNGSETVRSRQSFNDKITLTSLEEGRYTGFVQDCSGESYRQLLDFSITAPDSLKIEVEEISPITCYGVPNGFINVKAVGGVAPFEFWIDDRDPVASDRNAIITLSELDSGWHVVQVRDINGCIALEPFRFRLDYPTPLNFELDSLVMPLCHGGSDGKLFIRPFGGDTITQDYQVTIRSIVTTDQPKFVEQTSGIYNSTMPPVEFTGLHSAYYEVTVKDASTGPYTCSTIVDTVFLPQPTPLTINTTQVNMPSCAGATDGSVSVQAEGGTPGTNPNYYYSIDGTTYVAPNEVGVAVFSNLEAGNYTFYAIDAHHAEYLEGYDTLTISPGVSLCVGTLNFTLKEPELITVYTTMHPVTCYGTATGSITVDDVAGGWEVYTYEWSVLDPTANTADGYRKLIPADPKNLSDIPYGNYRLMVRDTAGCLSTTTIEVTQPKLPLAINAVQHYPESCEGTADGKLEVRAEGGYPPYQYQIDGGTYQANGFFGGLAAGAYLLTVRDARGCEVRQMANLTTDELTVEVVDQLPATIGFQDGLLRLRVTGGKNKSYYLDGVLSTTGAEFSGLAAGTHTVTIEYNGQCHWEQTYTIDEVAAPVPALRVTTQALRNVSCSDVADGSVSVAITGGVAPYTLQWNDLQQQTTSEATGLAKGTYTLTVTDAAGVTLDYAVTIDGPEPFEIINTVAASPACHQGADGYAEVTTIGGTAPYTYAWNDDQQQTTARASQLTAGTYTVTVTDQNGCTLTQELVVEPTPAPDDVLEPQAITLCTGQSVTVDAGAEWNTYRWTADNGFSSTAQRITIDRAGRYFLQVTNDRGCAAYDTLELVTTDNLIDAEFLLPTEIAAGDTVVLTEVSWPAPEQTVWLYDENVTTHQSDGEKEYVIFPEPGEYSIKLVVMVGACMDAVEKKIIVSDRAAMAPTTNGRLGYVPKNEYLIYPNPNHGKFVLKINTSRNQRVRVSVYDPLFKYRYHQQTFADTQSLEEEVDLTHLKHGVYTLMIETADEIKILRFVIR